MDLSKILSISGKPGLYKLVGESKTSIVIESMIDGKRSPAFSHERISSLKEISIYTETEDMPLEEVLEKIYKHTEGKEVINPKKASPDELKSLFEEIIPEYDRDAVYISDMKKVFTWYNFLLEKDVLEFSKSEPEAEKDKEAQQQTPETEEKNIGDKKVDQPE